MGVMSISIYPILGPLISGGFQANIESLCEDKNGLYSVKGIIHGDFNKETEKYEQKYVC